MRNITHHIDEGDVFASFMHPDERHGKTHDIPKHIDEGDVFASFLH